MPRIQPSLLRRANRLSPHLASLLPACRDLASAQNELRWIKNHVDETWSQQKSWHLDNLCRKRGRGMPLQYVLGSQPFGSLDIKCVDISPVALRLAQENIARNIKLQTLVEPTQHKRLDITRADVFSDVDMQQLAVTPWDILVSNPPYISEDVWNHGRGQLGYSVRKYEPRLALVPSYDLPRVNGCNPADVFYSRLLDISNLLKPKVVLFEIGDENQARRVLQLYFAHPIAQNSQAEVWRDWPDLEETEGSEFVVDIEESEGERRRVPAKGDGLIRSILIRNLASEFKKDPE
ncbi:hypothetical protein FSARC_4402 [Fusarium sarcochroum]|uniref:Mitochondrial N(5)-glutamine methyltransferase MTQ1 n=1 Tax=Fusarium sarcochroum TaxID=1208366 RepID=A0A8H4U1S9_9HYPO|nr:hypothetical protein FSARC_4402 [Fusarium sarcochroum]